MNETGFSHFEAPQRSGRGLSVVGLRNVNDVSRLRNFSASFMVSRSLGKLGSISMGGLHLFRNEQISDGVQSFYLAYSNELHKFSYTVGAGTGSFYYRSPYDMNEGNGAAGLEGCWFSVQVGAFAAARDFKPGDGTALHSAAKARKRKG